MRVVFERRGYGSPLVLIHGIGHRWQAWEPVMDQLAAHHEVIAVDLPGFGASPGWDDAERPYDMPQALLELANLFDELKLVRPHVAGNSLGGAIALELAARDRVATATALAPAGFWTDRQRTWALLALKSLRGVARAPEPLRRAIAYRKPLRTLGGGMLFGHPSRQQPETVLEDLHSLADAPGFELVAQSALSYQFTATSLPVPVTIAWGTRDRILLPRQAIQASEQLPGAWHVTLPSCGHVPMNDAPELVARTILKTCAMNPSRDAMQADERGP